MAGALKQEPVRLRRMPSTVHAAIQGAERAVLAEGNRPYSRESALRLAAALERRAEAFLLLSQLRGVDDAYGHTVRAIELAAAADRSRAVVLRRRLAMVSGGGR